MENILANVLKQELVYATMERQRFKSLASGISMEDWHSVSDKMKNNKKGQSLIRKTENSLDHDVIYDNFDCPLFVLFIYLFNLYKNIITWLHLKVIQAL